MNERNLIHEASMAEAEAEKRGSFSDIDSDAEIGTAVPSTTRARMVDVPKAKPPALPPRNPIRAPTSGHFTIKFKSSLEIPENDLVLRTSVDNWTTDRKGELMGDVWEFKLDPSTFTEEFECKFVILPDRWMHDPNLLVTNPTANGEIEFSDSRVNFPSPKDHAATESLSNLSLEDSRKEFNAEKGTDEDNFVSVPPSPETEKGNVLAQ